MLEHTINVRGGTVFAVSAGTGEALLMLHGWPLDHRMFEPQIRALADDLHVVALDRRGFGRSTAPADMTEELNDIDAVIASLNLRRVHLLGVSQGGRVALRYAATRPENIRSLILLGAVVDGVNVPEPDEEKVPVGDYARLARHGKLEEVVRRWLQHPMMRIRDDATTARQLIDDMLGAYSGSDLIEFDASHYAFNGDVLGALATSRPPLLLLTGEHETDARKQHATRIAESVPGSREVTIAGGGHLSNLTHAAEFNAAVRDFCNGPAASLTRS